MLGNARGLQRPLRRKKSESQIRHQTTRPYLSSLSSSRCVAHDARVVVDVFVDCRWDELMHAFLHGMRPFMVCVPSWHALLGRSFMAFDHEIARKFNHEFRVNDPVAAQKHRRKRLRSQNPQWPSRVSSTEVASTLAHLVRRRKRPRSPPQVAFLILCYSLIFVILKNGVLIMSGKSEPSQKSGARSVWLRGIFSLHPTRCKRCILSQALLFLE